MKATKLIFRQLLLIIVVQFYVLYGAAQNLPHSRAMFDYDMINISLKNYSAFTLIYSTSEIKDEPYFLLLPYTSYTTKMTLVTRFPSFGYQPYLPKLNVNLIKGLSFHPDYDLYEVNFDRNDQNNIKLYYWSYIYKGGSSTSKIFSNNRMLLAVNKYKKEYLFVSGYWKNSPILQYFDVDPSEPESYFPFLECKMYNCNFSDISYLRQSGDTLFFAMTRTPPGATFITEYSLDVNNPEGSLKHTGRDILTEKSENYAPISVFPPRKEIEPLNDSRQKAYYLYNALMKNIYLYRLSHLDSLDAVLGLNTKKGINSTILDSLVPAFDEQIKDMGMIQYSIADLRKINDDEIDSLYKYPYVFNTDPIRNWKKEVLGYTKKAADNIEFYRIYKPHRETLVRKDSKYTRLRIEPWEITGGKWIRRESFWYNRKCPTYAKGVIPPPPLPPLPKMNRLWKSNNGLVSYDLRPEDGILGWQDYYLLALDTKTREVHFISGPEIFLTKVLPFYDWSYDYKSDYEPDFKSWKPRYQLDYIQDRLYQYLIPPLHEENITYKDEEKMVVEIEGRFLYGKIPIKATIFFANAENLLIETPKGRKYQCSF